MPIDRPRDPLNYEPRFEFNPDAQSYQMLAPSAETIAQDMALAFARDIDGKMRAALISMGWAPPETSQSRRGTMLEFLTPACVLSVAFLVLAILLGIGIATILLR